MATKPARLKSAMRDTTAATTASASVVAAAAASGNFATPTTSGGTSRAVALAVDQPFRALIRVFGMVRRVMEPYFAKFGVSGSQWGVLRALHRAEEDGASPVPMTDLSNRLLIRPPSVTTTVAGLVRKGLIKRRTSSEDRRVKEISLSSTGQRLVSLVLANHQSQINYIMAGLNEHERQELGLLLGRLAEHLETIVDSAASYTTNGRQPQGSVGARQRRGRS